MIRRIAAAIAILLGAWLIWPAVVPLYDGPGNPDEPYRYVDAPAGSKQSGPPTTATAAVAVRNGVNTAAIVNSAEQGPQVSVYVPPGSLQAPPGATSITVTATPSAPKPPLPSDGTLVGDVYTIAATAPGGPVTTIGKGESQTPTLQMRAPTAKQPGPTFERFDGKKWTPSETIRVGQDRYQTSAAQLGMWALVQQGSGSSGLGGGQLVMLVLGIAILVVVVIIMVVRITRGRANNAG